MENSTSAVSHETHKRLPTAGKDIHRQKPEITYPQPQNILPGCVISRGKNGQSPVAYPKAVHGLYLPSTTARKPGYQTYNYMFNNILYDLTTESINTPGQVPTTGPGYPRQLYDDHRGTVWIERALAHRLMTIHSVRS